jgi:hypothetical protein
MVFIINNFQFSMELFMKFSFIALLGLLTLSQIVSINNASATFTGSDDHDYYGSYTTAVGKLNRESGVMFTVDGNGACTMTGDQLPRRSRYSKSKVIYNQNRVSDSAKAFAAQFGEQKESQEDTTGSTTGGI